MKCKPEFSQIIQYFCSLIIDCNVFDQRFSSFEGFKPVPLCANKLLYVTTFEKHL